jgi:hypothetical protein
MKNNAKSYRKILAVTGIDQGVVAQGRNEMFAEMTSPRRVAKEKIIRKQNT